MPSLPFFSLDHLTLIQGGETIFPNTNWATFSDEHWAIIGPNGSGKTTLMHALLGKIPRTAGEIHYHFMPDTDDHPEHHIEYVSFNSIRVRTSESAFYQARWNSGIMEPGLTVDQALSEERIWRWNPFQVLNNSPCDPDFLTRRNQIIALFRIESLLMRDVQLLSNGERRKLNIAQALLRQPKLLILDNVFEGLDTVYRKHLHQLLNELMQTSMRVYMVATDMENMLEGISHILAINNRRVVAQGARASMTQWLYHNQLRLNRGLTQKLRTTDKPDKGAKILIDMQNVNISYNGTHILENVNWRVCQGERWALLGHNGAGKTTLLSLILGDNPQAYANDIQLFGWRRGSGESIWEIKRHIGWMAPELHTHYPPLIPCIDVVASGWFDTVGVYQRLTTEQFDAVYRIMDEIGLSHLEQIKFRDSSETEQRLVLLARALVKHPKLLILDEPCQGLDQRGRKFIYHILDNSTLWAESLILVTHQTHYLPASITHILTLKAGRTLSQVVRT
ncbi:MAG: ATP-binding cassette domain-containing protein [Anaerolineae bacterium]|nr:ATP-binding cassette domain-containing protein [Anaerolineae bacterium]